MSYCFVWFESKIIKINSIFKQGKQNLTKARHFFFKTRKLYMLFYVVLCTNPSFYYYVVKIIDLINLFN